MAALLNSEPRKRNPCSWLWDSHVSPNNSKWLHHNLTEMDAKVRAILHIISEDADSFAQCAELYYKKRPELMNLVEDFYRAYRALAERYDHVAGELRLAHRAMPYAFPNKLQPLLREDHMPSTSEPHLPVAISPHLVRAFFYPDESDCGLSRKGLKELVEMFRPGDERLEDKDSVSEQCSCLSSDENWSCNAEAEMQCLKEALVKMEAERDAVHVEYRQSLEKISNLEEELDSAQNDVKELSKHANECQSEAKALKASFEKLKAERDSSLDQYRMASEKLVSLEAAMVTVQEETMKWSDQAVKAEIESQSLKLELSIYEDEKQDALHCYERSLEKISVVEEKLLVAEENANHLYEQIDLAKTEIKVLKEGISRLSKEKDDACFRLHQCLDAISKVQNELMEAKEDIRRLDSEIMSGSNRLKDAEDQCSQLEKMNQLLRNEVKDLLQKFAEKDQELFKSQSELEEILINSMQVEHFRFVQIEATLDTLQDMHCQSQEEHRALTSKLSNALQMLKDLESCKLDLELEIQSLREENQILNDHKLASSAVKREMENEVMSLKETKEQLHSIVRRQAEKNDAFEQQVCQLNKEGESSKVRMKDMEATCDSLGGENFALVAEKSILTESIENLSKKNASLENAVLDAKTELEGLREKLNMLEDVECENMMQQLEIASLREANESLDAEVVALNEGLEACKRRGVMFESELTKGSHDLELCEDVAISYYFDLQASAVREALFESKVHELSGLCNVLEDQRVRRCIDIERMEDKISFLESENKGLETQLAAYAPVVACLKNNVASLEQNLVSHTEAHLVGTSKEQEFTPKDGLSELQDLQSQILTIDKTLLAERSSTMNANIEHETEAKGTEELSSRINLHPHAKDILLDQMLNELNEVENGKVIVDRLSSDAQELDRLSLSIQELKRKIRTNTKSNSSKAVEYTRLSGQLQNMEGSIVHLMDVNSKLINTVKESSSPISVDSDELAKARKEAEKIGRLQLDVQKIQYLLLKLEDDKIASKKAKSRSMRSRTGVNLSDFLYSNGRRSRKQSKVHMCGCDSVDVLDPRKMKLDTKFASMPNAVVSLLSPLKR